MVGKVMGAPRRIFAILLLALVSCSSDVDIFERFVHPRSSEVKNLKGDKFLCMHCPWYFRFEAPKPLIEELILKHELVRVEELPCSIEMLAIFNAEDWFLDGAELPKGDRYWVEHRPRSGVSGESRIKAVIVQGQTVYWITGGFFPPEKYEKVTTIPDNDKSCRERGMSDIIKQERAKKKQDAQR